MRRFFAVLLIIPAILFAGAIPAGAAAPTIQTNSATLVANGVQIEYTVTCDAGSTGILSSSLTQLSGTGVAGAGGARVFVCSGFPQAVNVLAFSSGRVKSGDAVVHSSLTACGSFSCTFEQTRVVTTVK